MQLPSPAEHEEIPRIPQLQGSACPGVGARCSSGVQNPWDAFKASSVLPERAPRAIKAWTCCLPTSTVISEHSLEPIPVYSLPGDPCIPKFEELWPQGSMGMHHLGEKEKAGCFKKLFFVFKLCHPGEFWEGGAVNLCYCHYGVFQEKIPPSKK